MIAARKLGHLVLKVRDARKSRDFYTRALGLKVAHEDLERGAVLLSFVEQHHDLALFQLATGEAPDARQPGLHHSAWQLGSFAELQAAHREPRDLGIEQATHGQFRAHVIRIKSGSAGAHELHTTGLHQHKCDFQMFYVLRGWMKFVYEGQGEQTFHAGDCVLQPAGIVHNELDCSDDVEILEIYSPAVHPTLVVETMPEASAAR